MEEEIRVRVGKKAEEGKKKTADAEKAGPVKEAEVEGQGRWIYMTCPWCLGMNRCWDTGRVDVWSCSWCGGLFY